jgi:hypothetical protein
MSYLTATRYGLTHEEPSERLHAAGWRQVWRHPSGALAMRHPGHGQWVTSMDGGLTLDSGWASSLHAAALRIGRKLRDPGLR